MQAHTKSLHLKPTCPSLLTGEDSPSCVYSLVFPFDLCLFPVFLIGRILALLRAACSFPCLQLHNCIQRSLLGWLGCNCFQQPRVGVPLPILLFTFSRPFLTILHHRGLFHSASANCLANASESSLSLCLPAPTQVALLPFSSCMQQLQLPRWSRSLALSPGSQLREAKFPFAFQTLGTLPLQLPRALCPREGNKLHSAGLGGVLWSCQRWVLQAPLSPLGLSPCPKAG